MSDSGFLKPNRVLPWKSSTWTYLLILDCVIEFLIPSVDVWVDVQIFFLKVFFSNVSNVVMIGSNRTDD